MLFALTLNPVRIDLRHDFSSNIKLKEPTSFYQQLSISNYIQNSVTQSDKSILIQYDEIICR